MFAQLRLEAEHNSSSSICPSCREEAYPDSGNFEFSFWTWHLTCFLNLGVALEIEVPSVLLRHQVSMYLRQKIQKSRLKESTWIFEKNVSNTYPFTSLFLIYFCNGLIWLICILGVGLLEYLWEFRGANGWLKGINKIFK